MLRSELPDQPESSDEAIMSPRTESSTVVVTKSLPALLTSKVTTTQEVPASPDTVEGAIALLPAFKMPARINEGMQDALTPRERRRSKKSSVVDKVDAVDDIENNNNNNDDDRVEETEEKNNNEDNDNNNTQENIDNNNQGEEEKEEDNDNDDNEDNDLENAIAMVQERTIPLGTEDGYESGSDSNDSDLDDDERKYLADVYAVREKKIFENLKTLFSHLYKLFLAFQSEKFS